MRKKYEPDDATRKMVRALAGYGIPQQDMCRVVINPETSKPIDLKTLRRVFREELDTGEVQANAKVAESLFKHATGTGKGAVTAAIFWLKTRAGWKPTERVEHTGADGVPLHPAAARVSEQELADIAKRISEEV